MTQEQGPADTFINALKYAYSDITALLLGGIAALLTIVLIGYPLYYGYFMKSLRNVINGGEKAPAFDNIKDMYIDGIKGTIVMLPYLIVVFLVMLIVLAAYFIPMILALSSNDSSMQALWLMVMIVAMLIAIVIEIIGLVAAMLLMYASATLYAATGDIAKSINPLNAINLIMKDPGNYVIAFVFMYVVNLIAAFASIFIVTIPWAMQFAFTAHSYIFGKFYRRTQPVTIEKPQESPSFT